MTCYVHLHRQIPNKHALSVSSITSVGGEVEHDVGSGVMEAAPDRKYPKKHALSVSSITSGSG